MIRLLNSREDAEAVHTLYIRRHMVPPDADFLLGPNSARVARHAGCTVTVVRG